MGARRYKIKLPMERSSLIGRAAEYKFAVLIEARKKTIEPLSKSRRFVDQERSRSTQTTNEKSGFFFW